jgi:profilin
MSWQTYVDSNMVGTGKISEAVILGLDTSQWACSPSLKLSFQECASLLQSFIDASNVRSNGLTLAGRRHVVFKSDERSVYGKSGKDGVVAVKTGQAVLVGFYKDPVQAGEATKVVEGLADYLISVGF